MTDRYIELISYINNCPEITETIDICNTYGFENYYLAGGAITQLLWNNLLGKPPLENVKDFDIVYYSTTENQFSEKLHQSSIAKLLTHQFPVDVTNQAYVHQWYPEKFGTVIEPLTTVEDGILTWLPAFAIGVRKIDNYQVFAPYGLSDAFDMIIRPNKRTMTKENYSEMTDSFKQRWPSITILPWE